MKKITPTPIWNNGTTYQAEILNVYGNFLQLNRNADFYYSLFAINSEGQIGIQVSQGNLPMNDEEYAVWGIDDNYVWEFAANKLNLTIVGDWVAPTIEPPVETEEEYTQDVINGTNPEDTVN